MLENIINFIKNLIKKDEGTKDAAKERLQLVLMQDRANVSADYLDLMKQEIIDVIKKYVNIDENALEVELTKIKNKDGTLGAPQLIANIPIISIKENQNLIKEKSKKSDTVENKDNSKEKESPDKKEETKEEVKKAKQEQDSKTGNKDEKATTKVEKNDNAKAETKKEDKVEEKVKNATDESKQQENKANPSKENNPNKNGTKKANNTAKSNNAQKTSSAKNKTANNNSKKKKK